MAHHLARGGHEVLVWAREPEVAEGMDSATMMVFSFPVYLKNRGKNVEKGQ